MLSSNKIAPLGFTAAGWLATAGLALAHAGHMAASAASICHPDVIQYNNIAHYLTQPLLAQLAGGFAHVMTGFDHVLLGLLAGCVFTALIRRNFLDAQSWLWPSFFMLFLPALMAVGHSYLFWQELLACQSAQGELAVLPSIVGSVGFFVGLYGASLLLLLVGAGLTSRIFRFFRLSHLQ